MHEWRPTGYSPIPRDYCVWPTAQIYTGYNSFCLLLHLVWHTIFWVDFLFAIYPSSQERNDTHTHMQTMVSRRAMLNIDCIRRFVANRSWETDYCQTKRFRKWRKGERERAQCNRLYCDFFAICFPPFTERCFFRKRPMKSEIMIVFTWRNN